MLKIVLFFNLLVYANSEYLFVKIDGTKVSQQVDKTDMYDFLATYEFYENQLSEVNCSATKYGMMRYDVKDESRLAGHVYSNNITMLMKMRSETDGKYIDCSHKISGKATVVRIMLKAKKDSGSRDYWRVTVNDVTWEEPGIYRYVKGEMLQVSCQKTDSTPVSGVEEVNTWGYVTSVQCPKYASLSNTFSLHSINTRGVSGLVSSNIRFHYIDLKGRLIIQYEYDDNENITLSWYFPIENGKVNIYNVTWKNKLETSVWAMNYNALFVNVSTFSPTHVDNRSVVQFRRSVTYGNTKNVEEIWLVLCRKKSEPDVPDDRRNLLFEIMVAGGALTLLIIMLVVVWLIIRMKYGKPKEESSDNYYGNLSNEEPSGPFPAQWDTYANTMVESNENNTAVQDLYTTPVPKSLRQGKLSENKADNTYTNVPSHPAEEELYSDIAGYVNPFNK